MRTLNRKTHKNLTAESKTQLVVGVIIILAFFVFTKYVEVNAQLIPIPSMSSVTQVQNKNINTTTIKNDHKAPEMQILTTKLIEGKNVFRVKITDESGIKSCEIRYNGYASVKLADCVYDSNNIYKSLISAAPPSQTVQVYVKDPNGNSATGVKTFVVSPRPHMLDQISQTFSIVLRDLHLVS
ncbi:MAG TPA: hypothetical protein VJ729_02820 [Nitrososphaeraceae archaeon]|nr:hypothetical protein [Nitrososphaeraceae archaeon]